eukprot:g1645.t1
MQWEDARRKKQAGLRNEERRRRAVWDEKDAMFRKRELWRRPLEAAQVRQMQRDRVMYLNAVADFDRPLVRRLLWQSALGKISSGSMRHHVYDEVGRHYVCLLQACSSEPAARAILERAGRIKEVRVKATTGLVRVRDAFKHPRVAGFTTLVIMDFMVPLQSKMPCKKPLNALKWACQLATGLHNLHKEGIAHGAVKLSNAFLSPNSNDAALGDYDFSAQHDTAQSLTEKDKRDLGFLLFQMFTMKTLELSQDGRLPTMTRQQFRNAIPVRFFRPLVHVAETLVYDEHPSIARAAETLQQLLQQKQRAQKDAELRATLLQNVFNIITVHAEHGIIQKDIFMEWVAQKEPRVIALLKQDAMLRRFLIQDFQRVQHFIQAQRFQPQTHIDVETLLRLCNQLELTHQRQQQATLREEKMRKELDERAKLREKSNDITVIENVLNSLNE